MEEVVNGSHETEGEKLRCKKDNDGTFGILSESGNHKMQFWWIYN